MSITKDSKEWLAALALVPEKYTLQLCTKSFLKLMGHVWLCRCGARVPVDSDEVPHTASPPDISPDLLYAIRRAIAARDCMWTLSYSAKRGYIFSIHLSERVFTGRGETEDDAIIRAAASWQEAASRR